MAANIRKVVRIVVPYTPGNPTHELVGDVVRHWKIQMIDFAGNISDLVREHVMYVAPS